MSGWSPPSAANPVAIVAGLFAVLVLGYSIIVMQQLLPGMFVTLLVMVVYFLWRFLLAVEGIADALQRIASRREAE